MAIWYWDPVGGSDSNNGSSFALRSLTLQHLTSVAAGDTVRCIQSPAPASTGINATWTNGSNTVTLASALTQLVWDGASGNWTASSNVTSTVSATARKSSTQQVAISMNASFTTGKAAYFATGTLNCSGYQQLTFWMRQTAGTLSDGASYALKLCSDTAGATPVNSFTLPAVAVSNTWFPVTINLATNLGASIQSIALYTVTNHGAVTFQFNNINCALAAGAPALTLTTLISSEYTSTEPWFGVRSINGTTVIIDSGPGYTLDVSGVEPLYYGSTNTSPLYVRTTLATLMGTASNTAINYYAGATGTAGNIVTISGGWDSTAMTTQVGQTYLDGQNGEGVGLSFNSGTFNYLTISNINAVRYYTGLWLNLTSKYLTITADNFNNNNSAAINSSGISIGNATISITNLVKNGSSINYAVAGGWGNIPISASTLTFTNINSNWNAGIIIGNMGTGSYAAGNTINITNVCYNLLTGIWLIGAMGNTISANNIYLNSSAYYYGQIQFDCNSTTTTAGTTNANPNPLSGSSESHDNNITVGNITGPSASSYGSGILFYNANNNKITMTGTFANYSNNYAIVHQTAGNNYFISTNAVFSGQTNWTYTGNGGKLYLNTLDIPASNNWALNNASSVGSAGQLIVKNSGGILGQTYILPASWGITY